MKRLKLPREEITRRVTEVAAMLDLEQYLDRKPHQLSGGQQQRVSIARAISKTPSVFLFDEPLSNLDAKLRHHMRIQIARLHQQLRPTTVYVTHDQLEAMTLADKIVLMRDGRIEQIGSPAEIFDRPCNRYVASFVGSAPMNFIDARVTAGGMLAVGTELLPFDSDGYDAAPGDAVVIGIRPSNLRLAPADRQAAITGVVTFVEYLGSEALLSLTYMGVELSVQVSAADIVPVGDPIRLVIDEGYLHLFSAVDGRALRTASADQESIDGIA